MCHDLAGICVACTPVQTPGGNCNSCLKVELFEEMLMCGSNTTLLKYLLAFRTPGPGSSEHVLKDRS